VNTYFLLGKINATRYFLCVAACLGLVFAWLNRDGSELSFLTLLIIWQAQTVGPIFTLITVHIHLLKFATIKNMSKWKQLLLSGLVGSLVFTPVGLLIDIFLAGEEIPSKLSIELLDEFFGLAPPVIFVWLAINAPWVMGYRIYHIKDEPTSDNKKIDSLKPEEPIQGLNHERSAPCVESPYTAEQQSEQDTFFSLLPSELGRNLIYLEAELHYLKAVTDSGEALILYNIKDAENLFDPSEGCLCHRSYWVSKKHISSFEKVGRCGELTMSNGAKIPISKRKYSKFKAWFDGEV
jgi:hypothetical protein